MNKVFDDTLGWNEMVHRHLGEVLYYYFVKVTRFDSAELQKLFASMLKQHELGSVRVWELFGTYDLLIRAWLHPSVSKAFRDWLQKDIPYRLVHVFEVTDIDVRWYDKPDERALDQINERTVFAVQEHNKDLQKFIDYKLVTERPSLPGKQLIRFFTSVYFEGAGQELFAEDGKRFSNEISREISELGTIHYHTVDRGLGFSQMLIKGEAEDYFSISRVPDWISSHYKHLRARTETFLVHSPRPLVGNERLGRSTFRSIKGIDLWVNSVIPELYNNHVDEKKQKWLTEFVTEVRGETQDAIQTDEHEMNRERDRELLRSCMLAYLHDRSSEASKTLFGLFADLEAYLRTTHKPLLFGKLGLDRESLLERAKIESGKKHLAMGDVLKMVAVAASDLDRKDLQVPSGWEELIELRNKVMHGDFRFEAHLKPSIFATLADLRRLVEVIARETGITYTGD